MTGDGIDSHAPGQELLYTIRAAIAHDQWLRYREGFRRSAANSVGRGIHHCVTPPLGYRFVHEETDKHLERDPESAPALKELFDRKVAGESNPSLARWLKEQGYEYTTQGVQKVLKNRAYLGEARYGGFVTEEAHEALISTLTYDRAQAATAKGVRAPRTGVVSGRVLVQGVGRVWSVRKEAGKLQIQLRCLNAHCLANSVMAKHLDAEVERRVMTWQTKAKGLKFNRSYPTGDGTDPAAKLEAAEYAMTQFLDNLEAISIIGQERWNAQAAKYQAVVDKARAMVMAQASEHDAEVSFTRLGDRWSDATIPERRS